MKKLLTAALLLATMAANTARADQYLGMVSLADNTDRDVVMLGPCPSFANRPVSEIQLRVKAFAAEINHLEVEYGNGAYDTLQVKEHFYPGTESRWINLRGGMRCIKKIVIVGDSDTFGNHPRKQSKIFIFGR